MVRESPPDQIPWWCEMPYMATMASLVPACMIMFQIWQVMDCVNGAANIQALHSMLYIVFVLFLVVVVEVALIYNYIVLS